MTITDDGATLDTITVTTDTYGVCTLDTHAGRFLFRNTDGGRVSRYYATAAEAVTLFTRNN